MQDNESNYKIQRERIKTAPFFHYYNTTKSPKKQDYQCHYGGAIIIFQIRKWGGISFEQGLDGFITRTKSTEQSS